MEEWNSEEWQGRIKEQMEFSYKMFLGSFIGIILLILLNLIFG